jgi:transposase
MSNYHPITREQFDQVRPLLEGARKQTRPRIHDLYDVFCAILYREETNTAWRNLPDVFPPWRTVHEYQSIWSMPPREGGDCLMVQALHTLKPVAE